MRLRKWVKVVLTIIVIIFSIFVYENTSYIGSLTINNNFYLTLCISMWVWLGLGQVLVLELIWKK